MNRNIVLHHGTQMRDTVLSLYRHYPQQDANEIIRRMVFEIGEAVGDLNGRKDAGQMLYAAADACTAKLPVEDFRLPAPPLAAPAPNADKPAEKTWKEMNWAQRTGHALGMLAALATDRMVFGFILGVIARGRP